MPQDISLYIRHFAALRWTSRQGVLKRYRTAVNLKTLLGPVRLHAVLSASRRFHTYADDSCFSCSALPCHHSPLLQWCPRPITFCLVMCNALRAYLACQGSTLSATGCGVSLRPCQAQHRDMMAHSCVRHAASQICVACVVLKMRKWVCAGLSSVHA